MASIKVAYTDPVALVDGTPIPAGDFVGVQALLDGVLQTTIAPGVQAHSFDNVASGAHVVVLQPVDAQGVTGTAVSLSVSVAAPIPPIGAVTGATATVV